MTSSSSPPDPPAAGKVQRSQVPSLCLLGLRDGDDPVPFALALIDSLAHEGVAVSVCLIGADRESPCHAGQARLTAATGHAVHRIDVDLMPVPSIQRVVERAGADVDLVLLLGFEAVVQQPLQMPAFVEVLHAMGAPVALCADLLEPLASRAGSLAASVQTGLERLTQRGIAGQPVMLLRELAGEAHARSLTAALGVDVIALVDPTGKAVEGAGGPGHLDARGWRLRTEPLERLLGHAQAGRVERTVMVPRAHGVSDGRRVSDGRWPSDSQGTRRARIGVILDDCFDFYDEESLLQFELAGADLTPISALDAEADASLQLLDEVDGLLIGDGRIEKHSVALSRRRLFRTRLRERIEEGLPTLASGGGYAYLTRGLRTLSGALHPMVGVIDAEAVELSARPPFGHAEVETLVETLIGAPGLRLRGFVQRSWLVRGLAPEERGIYSTISGPRDEGCGRLGLLALHFRPYWPSCPGAAEAFVAGCVRAAVVREDVAREDVVREHVDGDGAADSKEGSTLPEAQGPASGQDGTG